MLKVIDDWILDQINFYDCLTTEQLCRLKGWKYKADMNKRLISLEKELLISSEELITNKRGRGNPTKVYRLTTAGKNRVSDTPGRVRRKEIDNTQAFKVEHWRHTLEVNDFLISIELLWRMSKDIQVTNVLTESYIYQDTNFPIEITFLNGEKTGYRPDGWIELIVNSKPYTLCLELERERYDYDRWHEKIEKMVCYREQSGIEGELIFPVLAREGQEHREQLLKWSAKALRELGREDIAGSIRITAYDHKDYQICTNEVWFRPGDHTPCRLFD